MSRDELIAVVRRQAGQITAQGQRVVAQDRQITAMAGELVQLTEANEALAAKLARVEHLLSRNPAGVWVRVLQRILALTAAIWHNDRIGAPVARCLTTYDH